jgi:hypothetical protein
MHKNATKCNKTLSKWCKNKHGASKIIDTFETYQWEILDTEAAASEGGLRGRLYGERRGSGDGCSLQSCGWRGADDPGAANAWRKPNSGLAGGSNLGAVRWFFWAKAQRFGANGGDACGCRNPLDGAVVVTFSAPKLWVKTLDHCGLDGGGALRHYSLGGVVAELWFHSVPVRCLRSSFGLSCLYFFYLDLLCKGVSPSPCIGSAVVALFIKRGKNLFRAKKNSRIIRFFSSYAA